MRLLIRRLILLPALLCLFLSVIPVHGATAEDYYNTGLSLYQNKKYTDAIGYLKAAVSLDPNHWRAFDVLALAENVVQNYVDALDHCEASLALHPDNPPLAQLDQELKPKVYTPPLFPAPSPKPKGRLEGPPLNPVFWIKGAFLFDYSLEEDLINASNGWDKQVSSQGGSAVNASSSNAGFGLKAEFGYQIDAEDAMSLCFNSFTLDGFQGTAVYSGVKETYDIQPGVYSFGLKYSRFWVHDYFRYYLDTAIGYYDVYFPFSGGHNFDKGDFGLEFGGGYELRVDKDVGLELSLSLRYASISEVTDGNDVNGYGLVVYPNEFMGVAPVTSVNHNGVRWAVFDLTGFQADLGVNYYIF